MPDIRGNSIRGLAGPPPGDLVWQAANGRPCEQVCRAVRKQPVQSG